MPYQGQKEEGTMYYAVLYVLIAICALILVTGIILPLYQRIYLFLESRKLRNIFWLGNDAKPITARSICSGSALTYSHVGVRRGNQDGPPNYGVSSVFKVYRIENGKAYVLCIKESGDRAGPPWATMQGSYSVIPAEHLDLSKADLTEIVVSK